MRYKLAVLSSVVAVFIGLTIVFWIGSGDLVQAQDGVPQVHPLDEINRRAVNVRSGAMEDATAYVSEIIRVSGFQSELRGFTADTIKDRVGRAESSYQQGLTNGIPEAKVVRTVNGLVRKFSLPEYAKTDQYEVRKLRLDLLTAFPQLISQRTGGMQPVSVGREVNTAMSPAEAVFILTMMLQQKMANPAYQQTYSERISRWEATHDSRHGRGPLPENRSDELRTALGVAMRSTSTLDALQLSTTTLNTLGVAQ